MGQGSKKRLENSREKSWSGKKCVAAEKELGRKRPPAEELQKERFSSRVRNTLTKKVNQRLEKGIS